MFFYSFQVIYGFIPKAGCSTWKRTMIRSYTGRKENFVGPEVHNFDYMRSHGIRRLSTYSQDEIRRRLKTYFKFLVVRHPIERLVSAFRAKFGRQTGVQSAFQRHAWKVRKQENNSENILKAPWYHDKKKCIIKIAF